MQRYRLVGSVLALALALAGACKPPKPKKPPSPGAAETGAAETEGAETEDTDAELADAVQAEVDLAPFEGMMKICFGDAGHPAGAIAGVVELPSFDELPVFLARPQGDAKQGILVFDPSDPECTAYSLGSAQAETQADVLAEGEPQRVFLAPQSPDDGSCEYDACPVAVVVEADDGTPTLAARTTASCNAAALASVRIFEDRDSLELRCTSMSGPDAIDRLMLLHVVEDRLRIVLDVEFGGSAIDETTVEDEEQCTLESEGKLEVVSKGAVPSLEVLEVVDLFEGTQATWTWSAQDRAFVRGEDTPVDIQARRSCGAG